MGLSTWQTLLLPGDGVLSSGRAVSRQIKAPDVARWPHACPPAPWSPWRRALPHSPFLGSSRLCSLPGILKVKAGWLFDPGGALLALYLLVVKARKMPPLPPAPHPLGSLGPVAFGGRSRYPGTSLRCPTRVPGGGAVHLGKRPGAWQEGSWVAPSPGGSCPCSCFFRLFC